MTAGRCSHPTTSSLSTNWCRPTPTTLMTGAACMPQKLWCSQVETLHTTALLSSVAPGSTVGQSSKRALLLLYVIMTWSKKSFLE